MLFPLALVIEVTVGGSVTVMPLVAADVSPLVRMATKSSVAAKL